MTHQEAKEICEESLENDLRALTPKDRLNFYLSLLEYFSPKMNRINFELDTEIDKIRIIDATKEDKEL